MIFYAVSAVTQAGVRDIYINVNEGDKEIASVVGDGARWGVNITYFEQKGGPKGLADVVRQAEPYIGNSSFIFYLGDNIICTGLDKFVEEFEEEKLNCLLALAKVKDPQRFGVPEIRDGRIIRVIEKPKDPPSLFAVTGIYLYDVNVFQAVKELKPSGRGEYEISDTHTWLIEHGFKVGYSEITGWWKDTGKPEDLLEGNQLILSGQETEINGRLEEGVIVQGKVRIGKGAVVNGRTTIRGPVFIGQDCIIRESYIGPFTSIGDRCEIYQTEIENSIIFDECDLQCGARVVDSLLGQNTTIIPAHSTWPSGHRLIVGSNSVVEL
jgi:glucose-1-phosphate thymidylyltransferase